MNNLSKLNSLRIEKRLTQSRLTSIESNLNRGSYNTRKNQADTEKISKLKNRLSEIETEIFLEKSKLNKHKVTDLNRTRTPSPVRMFKTPPKAAASQKII